MIDLLLFIPACFALNMAFGPNNLLALTHGAQQGIGFAIRAGVGRLLAFVPMILISGLGLGVILSTSAAIFLAVKIVGAMYLIWLGVKLLKTAGSAGISGFEPAQISIHQALRREAFVALGNPKAILIFAAFFPQFVDIENYGQSYVVLGAVFLVLECCAIGLYATLGRILAKKANASLPWFQRVSGGGMIFFGALLLFAKRPTAAP